MGQADDDATIDALERFAERRVSGAMGTLSADQTALYYDILNAVQYVRRLEDLLASTPEATQVGPEEAPILKETWGGIRAVQRVIDAAASRESDACVVGSEEAKPR
jgi:hypothetical protein